MGYGKLQLAIEKSLELLNLQRVPMFISKVGRIEYREKLEREKKKTRKEEKKRERRRQQKK